MCMLLFYRYIKWTEENFLCGGKNDKLIELIEHCLTYFHKEERYLNDPRFVRLWIKFVCTFFIHIISYIDLYC